MNEQNNEPLTMNERAELLLYRQRFGPLQDWIGVRDDEESGVTPGERRAAKHIKEPEQTKHIRKPPETKEAGG